MTKLLLELLKLIAPPLVEVIKNRIEKRDERLKVERAAKVQQALDDAAARDCAMKKEAEMKKAVAADNAAQHR